MTKFSNSQIISFQKCEKRFYYEHILKLKSKYDFPEALQRGINGHAMFEAFFRAMQSGCSYEECVAATDAVLATIIGEPGMEVYKHVIAFGYYVFEQEWEVILVEENIIYTIAEGIEFAFTPDTVFRMTKGALKGREFVVDFKFIAQFWSDREIDVFQQLPKYINGLNKTKGLNVRHAAVIMLNTRAAKTSTGSNLFLVKWLNISTKKLQRIDHENKMILTRMKRVVDTYEPDDYLRSADVYGCKICPFAEELCGPDLHGHDVTRTIERNFERNTYFDDNYGDTNESRTQETSGSGTASTGSTE